MDAMALHMREAANRDDVNEAIQVAAIKDMQDATSRVTGVRPTRALPKRSRASAPRKLKSGEVLLLSTTKENVPRLASG